MRCRALLVTLLAILCSSSSRAAAGPSAGATRQTAPPEIASYRMEVRLDPAAKTVAGSERITYRNPSQDTLHELWLRLYLKAFSRPDTLWMRESAADRVALASTRAAWAISPSAPSAWPAAAICWRARPSPTP